MDKIQSGTLYRERLVPGPSFYLGSLFVPIALFLVVLAFDSFWALFTMIASELLIVGLSVITATTIKVSKTSLIVGRAQVPKSFLGAVAVIETKEAFSERGPKLNPKAFVRFQVGIKGLLKIEIQDANDPTPYWLLSTRKPKQLAEALTIGAS